MPFLAEERYPIPTPDLLTWMFDDCAPYDKDKPVGEQVAFYISSLSQTTLASTNNQRYILMRRILRERSHIGRPAVWSADLQQGFGEQG